MGQHLVLKGGYKVEGSQNGLTNHNDLTVLTVGSMDVVDDIIELDGSGEIQHPLNLTPQDCQQGHCPT